MEIKELSERWRGQGRKDVERERRKYEEGKMRKKREELKRKSE